MVKVTPTSGSATSVTTQNVNQKTTKSTDSSTEIPRSIEKSSSTSTTSTSSVYISSTLSISTTAITPSVQSSTISTAVTTSTKTTPSTTSPAITTTVTEESASKTNNDSYSNGQVPPIIGSLNLIKNERGLLPKAMIKPNILNHVIDGMLVQEGTGPFPVQRQRYSDDSDEPPAKRRQKSTSPDKGSERLTCAHCGKSADVKGKLRKKPYCSTACVKAAKTSNPIAQQNGDHKLRIKSEPNDNIQVPSPSSLPSPSSSSSTSTVTNGLATATPTHCTFNSTNGDTKKNISADNSMDQDEQASFLVKWSVDDVCDYIRGLVGYSDYAEDFSVHEIDGQALLLLNENHLVQTMGIKLGPALKIMSKIEAIKNSAPQMEQ